MAAQVEAYRIFETAHGFAAVGWTDAAIGSIRLPASAAAGAERALLRRHPKAVLGEPPAHVAAAMAMMVRYFAGEAIDFAEVPVEIGEAPPFFARVYAHVRAIPWGGTTTYGAVARALGAKSEAAREVGEAMARNPLPLIVPCHRVLAAGGRLGGFSASGGTDAKARMLALEGVSPAERPARKAPAPQAVFAF